MKFVKSIKKHNIINRWTALLLSVLIILSVFGGIIGTVAAQDLTATDSHVIYSDTFDGTELDTSKWFWAGEDEKPQYTATVADGKLKLNSADAGTSGVAGLRYVKNSDTVNQRASVEFVSTAGLKPQLWLRTDQQYQNKYATVSGYHVLFNCGSGGWTEVIIKKRNDSYVTTDLAVSKFTANNGDTFRLELVAQGTAPTLINAYVYKVTSSGEAVVAMVSAVDNESCLQDAGTAGISYIRSSSVTTETTVAVDNFEYTSTDNVTGKYYVEEGSTGSKTFGQLVMLDPTKKYILTAHAKDNGLRNGEDVNPLWIEYFNNNSGYTRVLTGRASLGSNRLEADAQAAGVDFNEYFTVFYDEFDLSACTDNKEETSAGGKTRVIVGFRNDASLTTAGMFSHFTLYAADDPNKTNLLINPDFKMGLYGWNEEAGSYMNYTQMKESQGATAKGYATLKAVSEEDYKTLFQNTGYVTPDIPEKDYMLKNTGITDDTKFGQSVVLNKDTEYVYSVNYKNVAQNKSKPAIWYKNVNNEYVMFEDYTLAYEDMTELKATYHFKPTADDIKATDGSVELFVGYTSGKAGSEAYYLNFELYQKNDTNKSNIIKNPDFKSGLKWWSSSCCDGFAVIEDETVTATKNGCAELAEITDENYFIRSEAPDGKIVIHVNGDKAYGKVGNIVYLDPSKTYVYAVSYKYLDQKSCKPFIQYNDASGTLVNYDPDNVALSITADEVYSRNYYEFTVPAEAKTEADGTVKMKIGYTTGSAGANAYFGDFLLYEKDDSSKTNLLVNADFTLGLNGWSEDGNPITDTDKYSIFGSDLVVVADDFFKIPTVEKLEGNWVIHNTGAVEYAKFGQIVELDPNKTYVYAVSYKYIDQKGSMPYMRYYDGITYQNYDNYISETQDTEEYRVYYEFKAPNVPAVLGNGKVRMQIGITCGMGGADSYFGNFLLYDKEDANKTNIFVNADFALGLYGWTSNGYNSLPITDYGVMKTKQGDVELIQVADDYFARPKVDKLEGNWVIHNTGKVEYAKFGQIVELDPSKTYIYSVSYKYKDQKGSMPFMRYFDGKTYKNFSEYISETQDDEYYRVCYEFKVPTEAAVQANGKIKMQIGITCGMKGADANFGDFLLYDKEDKAKTNIFINSDFALGLYGWTSNGYNNLPISDYGVMKTLQGDVELIKVTEDYFKRPKFEKLEGNWVVHNTGKVEYAKFGQIVELDPAKTYIYSVSYKYEKQNGSMPFMLYFNGSSYVNYTDFISVEQDSEYYREYYEFKAPAKAVVQSNGKVKMKVGITCGMKDADAYFGDFLLYEKNDKSKENLIVNSNFELGLYGWTSNGYNNLPISDYGIMKTIQGDVELVKVENNYFKRPVFDKFEEEPMLHITGKWNYAHPGQIVELTPGETYYYSMYEKYFAQNGSKPLVFIKKDGSYTALAKELQIKSQDLKKCFTIYEFTVPKDIDVKSNGKSEVLVGFTTGITGADAYFYDLQLYSSKDDSKTNLFVNPDFELGLYGWTGTSYNYKPETEFGVKVFRYKQEAELLPYDGSLFVNDLSDEFFDDGDWASEYGNDYTMSEWLKKIGVSSDKEVSDETPISKESNNIYWVIIPIVCGLILIGGVSVIMIIVLKKKKKG